MANDRNTDNSPGSEIERAASTLLSYDAVVELRAFKDRTTVGGYFDYQDVLTEEITELNNGAPK